MAPDQINVERMNREINERLDRHDGDDWINAISRIVVSINLAPSQALKGFSPYEVVFQRKANIGKFLHIPNKFYTKPEQITINLDDFRKDRLNDKTDNLRKRKIKLGCKVWIRMQNHTWSTERYKVIRISETAIGLLNPNRTHELTRHPRDVRV